MPMPEERLALAWDPSSSRDATPTVSEEWRIFLWHLSWQRGRHGRGRGRGRGRRGMNALDIARSVARISMARRGCQRPWGQGIIQVPRPEDGGVNEELGPIAVDHPDSDEEGADEGEGEVEQEEEEEVEQEWGAPPPLPPPASPGLLAYLAALTPPSSPVYPAHWYGCCEEDWLGAPPLPPPAPADCDQHLPLKRPRKDEDSNITPMGAMAVKRPRLEEIQDWGGTQQTSDSKAYLSDENSSEDPTNLATEESTCALAKVEEPVAAKTTDEITAKELTAEGPVEEPVAAKTTDEITAKELTAEGTVARAEIALAKEGMEESMTAEINANESRVLEKTEAEIALAQRWLPHRYPAYPKSGKFEDFVKYNDESNRIRKLNQAGYDLCKKLPYWELKHDHETSAAVKDPKKEDIYLTAGEAAVSVSSVGPGPDSTTFFCSGVIISSDDDAVGSVRVLTSSGILYDNDAKLHSPNQKVYVKLGNDQKYSGNVLFVNNHYSIALLEVFVVSPIVALSYSTIPQYGQTVTVLGRDNMNLFVRDGIISAKEQTSSGRNHYMILESGTSSGFPVICAGGPVIDEDGGMVGIITCHIPEAAMLAIPILQICLNMWKNYRCIARPEMNMNLLTVQNLPFQARDRVRCIYEMRRGFIIDMVEYDSAPEKIGIRKGDIIEILDKNCGSTLPELEIYLLSHGLSFLSKKEGLLTKELELKIRVHDLVGGSSTDTRVSLPVVYERRLG